MTGFPGAPGYGCELLRLLLVMMQNGQDTGADPLLDKCDSP